MVCVKYYVIQILAFKKPDIFWHLIKVRRYLHVHEIHVFFFLSMLLSVKFKYDHKGRYLVWHINNQGKILACQLGLSFFLLSALFVELFSS